MINLEHNTLTEHAYAVLLDAFIQGDMKPGERLRIEDLAGRLGISPTPLRHALARLEGEGVVRSEPRRGLYVASLTPDDLRDLNEARVLYETFAAEKAAATISDAQLDAMRILVDKYAEIRNQNVQTCRLAWVSKDVELHQYLVDLAGNRRISASFGTLGIHLQTLRFTMSVERAPGETIREHQDIFQAFVKRDGNLAKSLLATHIMGASNRLLDVMVREPGSSA